MRLSIPFARNPWNQSLRPPESRYLLGEWLNARGLLGYGLEVGTFNGWFAADLLHRWQGKKLYLLDAWRHLEFWDDPMNAEREEQANRFRNTFDKVYSFGRRAVIIRELSEDAAQIFPDRFFDFVYLDADHSQEATLRDLNRWAPKVRRGGILAGHDYLDGNVPCGAVYGVKTAVDMWSRKEHREIMVIDEKPGHEPGWMAMM
jgi:hypothetical protein